MPIPHVDDHPSLRSDRMLASLIVVHCLRSEVKLSAVRLDCQFHPRHCEIDTRHKLSGGGSDRVLTNQAFDAPKTRLESQLESRLRWSTMTLGLVEQRQQNTGAALTRPVQTLGRIANPRQVCASTPCGFKRRANPVDRIDSAQVGQRAGNSGAADVVDAYCVAGRNKRSMLLSERCDDWAPIRNDDLDRPARISIESVQRCRRTMASDSRLR